MICGGMTDDRYRYENRCYKFLDKRWVETNRMSQARGGAGSGGVIIDNKLLASGGSYSRSQELIGLTTKSSFPDLPSRASSLSGHCIVQYNDNKNLMVLGGHSARYNRHTYIFDMKTQRWTDGPDMHDRRMAFGCTKVKVGAKEYIMAVGGATLGDDVPGNTQNSIEYLDVSDMDSGWVRGHPLPRRNSFFAMVTTPEADEVYMLGGEWLGKYNMKWSCQDSTLDSCRFQWLKDGNEFITMRQSRISHVAIPLPEELAYDICAY